MPIAATASPALWLPRHPEPHPFYDAGKRVLDVLLSLILLVPAFPVTALACVAVVLSTGEAPLLRQTRVGRGGREFGMWKLRTMRRDAGIAVIDGVLAFKSPSDERVTRLGRFLRRSSIDELPQLINVLLGDMSLVGPRPALPVEVARYPAPWRRRLTVKPGLTGLWQVSGRCEVDAWRRTAMDRWYIAHRSLALDAAILLRTIGAVASMRGAW